MTPQGRGSIGWRGSMCTATWLMPNRWHGGWLDTRCRATQSILYLGASLGTKTADRPDAFKDRCSTCLAVAHLRNDDYPAQPHGIVTTLKRWACGWELYRLVWFQTASSIEACSDHVQRVTMAFSGMDKDERQASGIDFWEGGTLGRSWVLAHSIGPLC